MIGENGSRQLIDSLAERRDFGIAVDVELKFSKHAHTAVVKASQTFDIIKHTAFRRSSKVMT